MNTYHSILAFALLAPIAPAAQSMPIPLVQSSPGGNISGTGSLFTYVLPASEGLDGIYDRAILSLDFKVSNNAAARNDTISLFVGGVLRASGKAASFSIANLDVSEHFDFETFTLTFELFRNISVGGGNIKLARSGLTLVTGTPGAPGAAIGDELVASNALADESLQQALQPSPFLPAANGQVSLQQLELTAIPEPGTLVLLGLGLLGLVRTTRRN